MSDFDLTLEALVAAQLPKRGRTSGQAGFVAYARDLTLADTASLGSEIRPIAKSAVQRLRHSHHGLARLVAQGVRPAEISAVTGYCGSRISVLKADPAFQELVEFYKTEVQKQFVDVHARLATLGTTAVEKLQDLVDDEEQELSPKTLLGIAEFALNGAGKTHGAPGSQGALAPGALTLNVQFVSPAPTPELEPRSTQGQVLELEVAPED